MVAFYLAGIVSGDLRATLFAVLLPLTIAPLPDER